MRLTSERKFMKLSLRKKSVSTKGMRRSMKTFSLEFSIGVME